jgi:hypothetical protein
MSCTVAGEGPVVGPTWTEGEAEEEAVEEEAEEGIVEGWRLERTGTLGFFMGRSVWFLWGAERKGRGVL